MSEAQGRAAAGGLVMAALAMLLGAAAWWWWSGWSGTDRPHAGTTVVAGATAPAASEAGSRVARPLTMRAVGAERAPDVRASAPAAPAAPLAQEAVAEPTGDLQVPIPVPLHRGARRMPVAAPEEASAPAATVDLGGGSVGFADAGGRSGRARLAHGAVTEAELGLRAPPGAVPRAEDSSRVQDAHGSMLTATSFSTEPLGRLAAFYRAQFAAAGSPAQEVASVAGQWAIQAGDGTAGQRSVLLIQEGAQVRITVSRWQPAAVPPPAAPRSQP